MNGAVGTCMAHVSKVCRKFPHKVLKERKWGKSSLKDLRTTHHFHYRCECSLGHVYLAKFVCQLVGMRKTLQTCVRTEHQIRKNKSTVQWLHLHVSHDSIASIHIYLYMTYIHRQTILVRIHGQTRASISRSRWNIAFKIFKIHVS